MRCCDMANRENVFLRKDGRFEARYRKGRDNNGKLIYGFCYGKTYEEARERPKGFRRVQGLCEAQRDKRSSRLPVIAIAGLFLIEGA